MSSMLELARARFLVKRLLRVLRGCSGANSLELGSAFRRFRRAIDDILHVGLKTAVEMLVHSE